MFGDGGTVPSFGLCRAGHCQDFLFIPIDSLGFIRYNFITLDFFKHMGMRKKLRTKWKADRKIEKVKRDKKKLKRLSK